jgi:hypothetical protein
LFEFTLEIVNNLRTTARWATMLVTAATVLCGIATADTITATGVDTNAGQYDVWIQENGQDVDTYFAGVINIQLTDSVGNQFNRDTMCVQLFTDIYLGRTYGTTVETPDGMGGGSLDQASWLLDNALMPGQNGGSTPSVLPSADWVTTAAQGAGLQLAIWDLVENGGNGFSKGQGSVQAATGANPTDPTVLGWAVYYENLALIPGNTTNDAFVYVNVDLGNGNPAQMLEGPEFTNDNGPQPTPEPSTLVLAGTALAALALAGRRKAGMLGGGSAKF